MNQTDVRTFKATTMQEALDIVRRELGPDAVILHTREIPQPRFLKWRAAKERVEVTAGTGVNVRTPKALLQTAGRIPATYGNRTKDEYLAPPPSLLTTPAKAHAVPPQTRHAERPPAQAHSPITDIYARRASAPASTPSAPTSVAGQISSTLPVSLQERGLNEQQSAISRQLSSIQQMVSQLS